MAKTPPVVAVSNWDEDSDEVVIKVVPKGYKIAYLTENADGSTYITLVGPDARK
jgi:hypothetical protein